MFGVFYARRMALALEEGEPERREVIQTEDDWGYRQPMTGVMQARRVALALALEEDQPAQQQRRRMRKRRSIWVHAIFQKRKEKGVYHHLVQELKLHEDRFQEYFRMTRLQFQELLQMVGPLIQKNDTILRESIGPEKRLAICIQ